MKVNNGIILDVGNVSFESKLGEFYQDFTPAINHIEQEEYCKLDKNGLPYYVIDNEVIYSPIIIIQYGLMCHDLLINNINIEENSIKIKKCLNWLVSNKELFKNCVIWRNKAHSQYNLQDGWVSGMYQGQALSFFLRAYQLYSNDSYLEICKNIFEYFNIEVKNGGVKRYDENGFLWFEEYPTQRGSYVLNGFVYTILGILDYYRVTKDNFAKEMYDECIKTLKANIHKYDVWYWSIYDQEKQQLVSYYYQKNVHIPLMKIMYKLTNDSIFNSYAIKWEKNLNSGFNNIIVKLMYRLKPKFNL